MRFECLIGAAFAGVMVLGATPAVAVAGPSFTWSYSYTVQRGGGSGGCRAIARRPYRGVVEGSGEGFIEEEIDTEPENIEVMMVLDYAHELMSGQMSRSNIGRTSPEKMRSSAIEAYQIHLDSYPEDWYTMREYALALMLDQRYELGLAKLIESYLGDEALVRIPVRADLLCAGTKAIKELTVKLVRHAKANDSGEAWFAVAALLQARGEDRHALKNLERAIDAGLNEQVAVMMDKALRTK
jgi:tetratricopeptide (TPR) repeat protein